MKRIAYTLITIAIISIIPTTCVAITSKLGNDKNCDIILSGSIEDGRLKLLKQGLDKILNRRGSYSDPNAKLCLNSDGGSFSEALKIVKYVQFNSINTVVLPRHRCLSACALIFMFGNHYEGDDMRIPARRLHVSGQLGFHAPLQNNYSVISDKQILADAYRAGVLAVSKLLNTDSDEVIPRSLLLEMLAKGQKEQIFADTVAKAATWRIDLAGYKRPTKITNAMLEWACLNERRSQGGPGNEGFKIKYRPLSGDGSYIRLVSNRYRKVYSGFGSEGEQKCYVDIYRNQKGIFKLGVSFLDDAEKILKKDALEKGDVPESPIWYLYPGDKKLIDIAEEKQI